MKKLEEGEEEDAEVRRKRTWSGGEEVEGRGGGGIGREGVELGGRGGG